MLTTLSLALLAACAAPDNGGSVGGPTTPPAGDSGVTSDVGAGLEGTSWLLTGIDAGQGAQAPSGGRGEASFSFQGGRLSGSAGCNRLGASYTLSGETLSVGPMMGTQMACPEPLMQQENLVSDLLVSAVRAVVSGDTLTISTADGRSLEFSRA